LNWGVELFAVNFRQVQTGTSLVDRHVRHTERRHQRLRLLLERPGKFRRQIEFDVDALPGAGTGQRLKLGEQEL